MADLSGRDRTKAEQLAADYTDRASGSLVEVRETRVGNFFFVGIENGVYGVEVDIHPGASDGWEAEIEAAFEQLRSERDR